MYQQFKPFSVCVLALEACWRPLGDAQFFLCALNTVWLGFALTRNERLCLQFVVPVFVHFDLVLLLSLTSGAHALLISVPQNGLTVLSVHGVEDIEKVLSVTGLSLWELIWHKTHKFYVLAHFGPQIFHA